MIQRRSLVYKLVASSVVIALQALYLPAFAAPEPATVVGTVVAAEGLVPLEGVRVHVADPTSGEVQSSGLTSADGKFAIRGLAPTTLEIAVESEGVLYVVAHPLQLTSGESRELNLVIRPMAAEEAAAMAPASGGVAGVWSNPFTASLLVVGIAVGVGLLIEAGTDESPASPS